MFNTGILDDHYTGHKVAAFAGQPTVIEFCTTRVWDIAPIRGEMACQADEKQRLISAST